MIFRNVTLRKTFKSGVAAFMAAALTLGTLVPTGAALADDRGRDRHDHRDRHDRHDHRGGRHDHDRGRGHWHGPRPGWHGDRHWGGPPRYVVVRPRPDFYRPYYVPRVRYYDHVRVYRPYGRPYPGFGFYYSDNDALRFLGLTALGLVVFNQLNESQQRAHEEAFVSATNAPIGESIVWNEDGRSGSVTAVRDGQTPDGRQCREFQQDVTIGGKRESAYGTACMQPDGSWEVVDNG